MHYFPEIGVTKKNLHTIIIDKNVALMNAFYDKMYSFFVKNVGMVYGFYVQNEGIMYEFYVMH